MSGDLVKESRVSFCWPASAFSCTGSLIFAHTYWQIISWPPQSHYLFLCILSFYLKESKSLNIVFVKFRHELNTNNTKICEGTMKKLWDRSFLLHKQWTDTVYCRRKFREKFKFSRSHHSQIYSFQKSFLTSAP